MAPPRVKHTQDKGLVVFVTVGTTLFDALIDTMTSRTVLDRLAKDGYTRMIVQYGKGKVPGLEQERHSLPLDVEMYDFKKTLADDMQRADLIVGHAGAGTVSEVLSLRHKKLVVVINTSLMHNHQTELAHAMRDRNHLYVVEDAALLAQAATWRAIAAFTPVPLAQGDPYDFPRMLEAFLK